MPVAIQAATSIDDAALKDEQQAENWLAYGRNYSEQRYSPLEQINAGNVASLGLAWSMPLPEDRSLLSTPLVVDGVMYFTGSWSRTRAVEAATGKLIWEYDPEYDQILIGTGNGSPWNQKVRSPGGGDNLFLCSIVALDAKTGKYKWHYQTVPGEIWDYNSSMDMVLADLKLEDGAAAQKVLLHAPKNGFFYVIDRKDGKVLSAETIAKVTWATGIDMKTGRPIEAKGARCEDGSELIWPSVFGAHNWHAMSFNPRTGLVYIPKAELPSMFTETGVRILDWTKQKGIGEVDMAVSVGLGNDIPKEAGTSSLLAWNPGTMTTAGNLVFEGRIDGTFAACDARNGKALWSVNVGSGISAPPITYSVGGKQYVSLLVGWGGAAISLGGGSSMARYGWGFKGQTRQLLTFALDSKQALPDVRKPSFARPIVPPDFKPEPHLVDRGQAVYTGSCVWCHSAGAVSGGYAPDLRASTTFLQKDALRVVLEGALVQNGMPRYPDLSDDDLNALQHYVRNQAIVTTEQQKD